MTGAAPLHGRTAVVTGAGRGIGEAVARALAEAGAHVLLAARSLEAVEAVASAIRESGGTAWAVACDVTDEASVEALAEAARERLGHVDVLINNAGASSSAPVHRIEREEWDRLIAVNATGVFLCTRAFLPAMRERGWGRVVTIASVAGLHGAKYIAAYTAAKHAAVGFTRAAAAEIAGTGVTVNAVCPGYVDTEMTRRSVERIVERTGRTPEQALEAILATSSQHRLVQPDEVAHNVLALCDPRAGAINGQAIVLDGGAQTA